MQQINQKTMRNTEAPNGDNVVSINNGVRAGKTAEFVDSLSHAVRNEELCVHYQLRFDAATGKAGIFEALLRWQRPDAGLFYPEIFIPVAEENGLIFSLDLWVFEKCCKDLKYLHEHVNPHARIAVNLSVLACESMYFSQRLIEISDEYGVQLSDFEFEITESTHIHDVRKVVSFCETLTNYGATFSLDDFGTGQSPLINLCLLPVSAIKIDRAFVHGIGNSKRCEIIITSLVKLAKQLGMEVVAEGIETAEQYHFLNDLGCNQLQGFLLSRPLGLGAIKSSMLYEPDI